MAVFPELKLLVCDIMGAYFGDTAVDTSARKVPSSYMASIDRWLNTHEEHVCLDKNLTCYLQYVHDKLQKEKDAQEKEQQQQLSEFDKAVKNSTNERKAAIKAASASTPDYSKIIEHYHQMPGII